MKQEAAVLVALVDLGGEAGLLFNKRSTNLSSHRGQVGTPFVVSQKPFPDPKTIKISR